MKRFPRLLRPYWEKDGIVIYHGDCHEILPLLPKVDLVLTDPPYGIKRFQKKDFSSFRFKGYGIEENLWWDIKPNKKILLDCIHAGKFATIWGMNNLELPQTEHFLVWDKFQDLKNFSSVEIAWCNLPQQSRVFRYSIHKHNMRRNKYGRFHPTEKPEFLMRWCIQLAHAETILDPFMGSGTTLMAAKRLGKKATGIEIEEKYCQIAIQRLSRFLF